MLDRPPVPEHCKHMWWDETVKPSRWLCALPHSPGFYAIKEWVDGQWSGLTLVSVPMAELLRLVREMPSEEEMAVLTLMKEHGWLMKYSKTQQAWLVDEDYDGIRTVSPIDELRRLKEEKAHEEGTQGS